MTKNIFHLAIIAFVFIFLSCSKPVLVKTKWTKEQAPAKFKAHFVTTKGNFDIEATRSWSPLAVDRLYILIKHGFLNNVAFYRTVPSFVAQFGSASDSVITAWQPYGFTDEPVIESNLKGTLSFARSGKKSRSTQLFINLKDNEFLDVTEYNGVKGFPVIGLVTNGMEVVEQLYSGYANAPQKVFGISSEMDPKITFKNFPKLDLILKASIIK